MKVKPFYQEQSKFINFRFIHINFNLISMIMYNINSFMCIWNELYYKHLFFSIIIVMTLTRVHFTLDMVRVYRTSHISNGITLQIRVIMRVTLYSLLIYLHYLQSFSKHTLGRYEPKKYKILFVSPKKYEPQLK